MIFLFDVDGVCGDMISKVLQKLEEHTKTKVPEYNSIINHDLLDPNKTVLSKIELDFVHKLMVQDGFANTLDVIEGCKTAIDSLRKRGHTIKWLTAPYYWSKTWCFDRLLWLKTNFGATEEEVIYAKDKSLVCGDVFVDDKISNVEAWQKQWKNARAFLFPQPWNAQSKLPHITWNYIEKLG